MQLSHPFDPVFNENSSILILGTFPSVKSRECGFFYGHPQNRFWKIIAHITNADSVPLTITDKKQMLLTAGIALADVLQSCDVEASSDSSIKNVVPADLAKILRNSKIDRIYANGEKAHQLFMKYFHRDIGKEILKLPSSSPANAQYSLEKLISEWEKITI
ncbi:MAG: DNA-deoxyinosine glycosylase [Holosporaceae bacterium]|jgi:hypoxanthine-DNA glycosylase|nr:DNA-deoxyinosine glycosylase [Holosporaceae bacterium]